MVGLCHLCDIDAWKKGPNGKFILTWYRSSMVCFEMVVMCSNMHKFRYVSLIVIEGPIWHIG